MSKTKTNAVDYLTIAEALSLLATHTENKKLRVHTLEGTGFGMMGCDMDLTQIKRELNESFERDVNNIRLSGPNMRGMQHGVAYLTAKENWLFLETKKDLVDAMFAKKGLK